MLVRVFLLFVFPLASELTFVDSAEYPAPIQFIEEPKNIKFSNKKSAYLYCRAKETSSYSNSYKIIITWRYSNGSSVKNISNTITDFANGTLWFSPFQYLVPRIHQGKFQCVAKLSWQKRAILSRVAVVNGIILKPFKVTVKDQYVVGTGGTATFTCVHPKEVSSYVRLKRWWINKEFKIVNRKTSRHLVILDVQDSHAANLYYCMVENILTGEIIASNVARLFIQKARGLRRIPLELSIQPENKSSLAGETILFECLTTRKNADYIWKHNDKDIRFDDHIFSVAGRSLRITKTSLADIGKYTCDVWVRNNNESISASSHLLVRVPLAFRAGPVKIATSPNLNVTFHCEVNGYPRPTITWYKDAKEITNNNKTVREGNNLVITTAWVRDEGIYQCTASNGIEMIHEAASLIVGAQPPMITKSFNSQELKENAKIDISCKAIGDRKPTVSWYHDGKLIVKDSDNRVELKQYHDLWTLQIKRATAADSGLYRCEAKNHGGMNFSEADILIKGPAKITFISSNITSVSGQDVNITCKAKGYQTPRITWLDESNNLLPNHHRQSVYSEDGESILTIEGLKTSDKGNYKCRAISEIGPPDNSKIHLDVYRAPETKNEVKIKEEGSDELLMCRQGIDSKWTKDGKSVENPPRIVTERFGGMALLLRIMNIQANDSGDYCCSKTTNAGVHKDLIEIVVITRPRFTNEHRKTYNVLEHGNIQMLCPASGFPTPRVEWKRNVKESFERLPDSSRFRITLNGSLTILNATMEDDTHYSCIAYNSKNNKESRTSKLNVNVPAKIVNWQTIASGDVGNTTQLDCYAKGNQKLIFKWLKNNEEIVYNRRVTVKNNPWSSNLIIKGTVTTDAGNYTCKVKNAFGEGEKTATVIIRDKPSSPILTKPGVSNTFITVFWYNAFDGNSPILSYLIAFKKSWKPWNEADTVIHTGQTSYVISELQPYTRYNIRVQARNLLGLSNASKEISVETHEAAPSAAPSSIIIIPGDKSFRIQWERLSRNSSNGVIKGYVIRYKKVGSNSKFHKKNIEIIHGTETSISNLEVYTLYEIMLQAFTEVGYGPNSESIVKRTNEGVPSKPPTKINITVKSSTAISLSWKPPPQYSINGKLVGYHITYQNTQAEKHSLVTNGNQTIITIGNLRKYTQYSIKLAARTSKGVGATSHAIKCITKEDLPEPPKDLNVIVTSVTSIKLEWEKPDNPNGIIIAYRIYYVQNEDDVTKEHAYSVKLIHGTKTSYEFEKMTENRTYYFWISARTNIGEGNSTPVVTVSTSKGPPTFIKGQESSVVTAKWKTTVTLVCYKFTGIPTPTITWLDFRGKPLDLNKNKKYDVTHHRRLIIYNLQREDSQRYVCKVTNKHGTKERAVTLKVQEPPSPPQNFKFSGINATAINIAWQKGFDGNSIITNYSLKYLHSDGDWEILDLFPGRTNFTINNIRSGKFYTFQMRASNEIGRGKFSKPKKKGFLGGAILKPTDDIELNEDVQNTASSRIFYKDSAVLGTLIGVCLFIVIVIVVLVLLTKLGFNPGAKLVQRSVNTWRWLLTKRNSSENRRRHRTSGGSSTDGHLGGSSSSLSQQASNNGGSQFSLPRTSSGRVTESGFFSIPLPFSNFTPGSNGSGSVSGSSDEGIGDETRGENSQETNHSCIIPPRSSNGTPAPMTLMMSPKFMYIHSDSLEKEATSTSKRPQGVDNRRNVTQNKERKKVEDEEKDEKDISPDSPVGKETIFVQLSGAYNPAMPLDMSPQRPKYEDGHFIIGPDIDHILAYRPPRCYDSTSSEYSSSRDELAQAFEFGKLHHLDDFYGRPTLESVSSSGETAGSEKDGICHFTTELSVGRPFLIPVAILPPPPNQRLRTRNRNTQAVPLKTYYEKDETLV